MFLSRTDTDIVWSRIWKYTEQGTAGITDRKFVNEITHYVIPAASAWKHGLICTICGLIGLLRKVVFRSKQTKSCEVQIIIHRIQGPDGSLRQKMSWKWFWKALQNSGCKRLSWAFWHVPAEKALGLGHFCLEIQKKSGSDLRAIWGFAIILGHCVEVRGCWPTEKRCHGLWIR